MIRSAARSLGVALAGLLCASAGQLSGQQSPTFRGRVDLINVDVSVLDKQNQPVRGLTAKDFTILEDGKPQTIQTFAPIDLPGPDPASAAWTRDVAPDVHTNAETQDLRLVVIVIDDAMLPVDPAMVANSKKIGKDVIERLGAEDLAAVVFTRNAKHGQDFTQDHARLIAAVDATEHGGMDTTPALASVDTLSRVAEALEGVADRRKTIVWIGIGLPATPWELSTSVSVQKELYYRWVGAMDAARRANVNVFPVDPGGLDGLRYLLSGRPTGSVPASAFDPTTPAFPRENGASAQAATYRDYLLGLASNTGGRAFVNGNEFDSSVAQILRETGSFYLLGYVSTNTASGERLRKIQIKTTRPGVTIRARSGYYPTTAEAARADAAAPTSPVVAALAGLLPRRDIPITVAASAFVVPDDGSGAIVLAASVKPPFAPPAGMDVLFEALGDDGKLAASQHARATPSGRELTGLFEATARLDVLAGHYQVRVASGGPSTGVGSVYCDVDVPDVRKEPLAWSGAIVGHAGDRRSVLGPIVPITPVTSRAFAATDDMSAFARLYQGGGGAPAAATIHTRILDESGAARLDLTETIPGERFGVARAADIVRVLPLSQLAKGQYLLSLEATVGKSTARRDIRFEVR